MLYSLCRRKRKGTYMKSKITVPIIRDTRKSSNKKNVSKSNELLTLLSKVDAYQVLDKESRKKLISQALKKDNTSKQKTLISNLYFILGLFDNRPTNNLNKLPITKEKLHL